MNKTVAIANYEHLGKVCWGNDTMRRLFHTEEERLEKYPGVRYGWDNEAYTYDNLAEEDPELLEYMKYLKEKYPDRIQIGAVSYGQPLSYYINGESNVRQLTEGIRTDLEYFGQRPYVYNMSEHGMHAQIPQLIAQAGFTGAVMRTSFCMYGVNPEYPASCIRWFGPDGVMPVPTVPTYPGEQCHCAVNGYSHDRRTLEFAFFGANTLDNKILLDYPVNAPWGGLEEFRDRFAGRIKNIVAFRADDPRQPEGIVAEYHQKPGFTWVLDEEILAAAGEPETDVHSEVNDWQVRMPWGLCGNWIWEKCGTDESRLFALDSLDALRTAAGKKSHDEELREAWKMLLICQHHDVQICGLEADAHKCFDRGDRAMERAERDVLGEGKTGYFNPLPWKRADEDGRGALCVSPAREEEDSDCTLKDGVLRTPFYEAKLDPEGGFLSMRERETGREIFASGRRSGILAGTVDGQPRLECGAWQLENASGKAALIDSGAIGGIPYEVRWTFYAKHPRVDCSVKLEPAGQFIGRKTADPRDAQSAFVHDEKLRMKFYPALPDTAMGWRDAPYAVAETNRQSLECNHWAAVSDGENGFAIFNRGVRCVSREVDGALSVPLAYSMYYIWSGTLTKEYYRDEEIRRAQAGETSKELVSKHFLNGVYETRLAFLPFTGTWEQAQLQRRALEYSNPCVAVSAETAEAIRAAGFELELPENAFLSSLYTREGKLYLRLYELAGREAVVSPRLRGRAARLTPVDFLENPTGEPVGEITLGAHQVRTWLVE